MKHARIFLFSLAAPVALLGWALAASSASSRIVTTSLGQISGIEQHGAHAWLGIPYAAPPVGEMRWKAPAAAASWSGVRDGSRFATSCYQSPPGQFGPYTPEFLITLPVSEDCLYLNVWAPATPAQRLPVMFFIHGGGYGSGSGSIPIYNGARLAAKGAVVVTINYRLGPFGYLVHPALSAESARKTSGNYGLLDMIAALQWVRDNAARFGGDPARVTIVGQSAGAAAVHSLQFAPEAKGLFFAAVAMSGSGGGGANELSFAQAEEQGIRIGTQLGATTAAALRALPADALLKASQGPPPGSGLPPGPRLSPVPDGKVLQASARDAKTPVVTLVPLLTGGTLDEPVGLNGLGVVTSPADFESNVRQRFGALATRMLALYPHATAAESSRSTEQLARDQAMANAMLWSEERATSQGQSVYVYLFDHAYPVPDSAKWGSFHTAEIPYLFGALDAPGRVFNAQDAKVVEQMQTLWLNFARTGNPNAPGQSQWTAVRSGSNQLMQIGDRPGLRMAATSAERLAVLREARVAAAAAPLTPAQMVAGQQQAMKKLAMLDGAWRGSGWMVDRPGETPRRMTQTYRVGPALDGTLKIIEARAYLADGSVGFHSFNNIAFDAASGAYTMQARASGRAGAFSFRPTDDGYIWQIGSGDSGIRYTGIIKDGVWTEVGEALTPGKPAARMSEWTVRRTGDTNWPDGDADIRGTGPYPALVSSAPGLPTHVVYHPADLAALGQQKLGIFVWGNGGCRKHNAPFPWLGQVASHGYLVVTPGEVRNDSPVEPRVMQSTGGAPAQMPPPATSPQDVMAGLEWAIAENSRKGSRFEGRLDTSKVAVAGHSCGGLQALRVGNDARVKAVIIHNSGTFPPSANPMRELGDGAAVLPGLHTPVLYVLGGKSDVAHVNGMADFDRITKVPVMVLDADLGHGGTFREPTGGHTALLTVAWLDWQLNGNADAARTFVGKDCRLCSSTTWSMRQKGF